MFQTGQVHSGVCSIDYCNVTAACGATFPMQYWCLHLAPSINGSAEEDAARRHRLEPKAWDSCSGTDLIDGEHVEVGDVVLLRVLDSRPALLFIDQLADVLVDKLALRHIRAECPDSPPDTNTNTEI